MKILRFLLLGFVAAAGLAPAIAQQNRPSPAATVTARIDGADFKIDYSRPSMRGRKIWGGLVPFGEVWRTGANEATTFAVGKAIVLGGTAVPAGTYSLYSIPAADGSAKLIVNKQTGQSGTEYDQSQDLARVDLKRAELAQAVEQFAIAIEPAGAGGVLSLSWDKVQYSVPFTVKK